MGRITVDALRKEDIGRAIELWTRQYKRHCGGKQAFPQYWLKDTSIIERELLGWCKAGNAFAARTEEGIAGYLSFDEFTFRGERTVTCPVLAHAAEEEHKESVYLVLYKHASQLWVNKGIFSHIVIFLCNDERLKTFLYDLGFGAYVMDLCCLPAETAHTYKDIRRAGQNDVDALFGLVEESRLYYRNAPIFLKRDVIGKDNLKRLVEDAAVFIAEADGGAVGFMNASVAEENDPITMVAGRTALIDEIGAYIKPEYRGRGIGERLLRSIQNYCAGIGIERIHVDFETANPFANRFWRKHFTPMLLSVKRGINRDLSDD